MRQATRSIATPRRPFARILAAALDRRNKPAHVCVRQLPLPAPLMKTSRLHHPLITFVLTLFLAGAPLCAAKGNTDEKRAEARKMRDQVLADLYKLHPDAKAKIKKAAGYAVFSNVGVNLLFASVAGGSGVVVQSGFMSDTETFMKMASAGIGIGLGVKDFRAVFVFSDKDKLRDFVEKGWDFSGQADAAAKSDDKGAAVAGAATVFPGVEVYQITKNGLALQATLQGTKYWKDKDLN
jgi:lipid-binding SYLF domain-containing protein